MLFKKNLVHFFFILLSLFFFGKSYAQKPAIVEFGWDYPDVAYLYTHIDSIQNIPFDGICFSTQANIIEAFDTAVKTDEYFELKKLSNINWGRFTDNYLFVRGMAATGGSWFSDQAWVSIEKNVANLSRAMLAGKLKGILFDPEYYYPNQLHNPWTYNKNQYPNKSFKEVQDKVRERGTQFIKALQKSKPDFSFLSIWLASLVAEDKKLGPLENARHALLPSFIEGILIGKNKQVSVVDGNEYGYWNIRPSQFLEAPDYLQKNTVDLMNTSKGKQLAATIKVAQPVFYDGLMGRTAEFEKGIAYAGRWKWLEENLKLAMASSGSNTVWFYNERINWWKNELNDTLTNILERSKTGFIKNTADKSTLNSNRYAPEKVDNVNSGKGFYYFINIKEPMQTGEAAFTFSFDEIKNRLTINFIGKIPESASIFLNNHLLTTINPKQSVEIIPVTKPAKSNLAIQARYGDSLEACGFQIGY